MADWERRPHGMLDYLMATYKIKNDAELAKRLNVTGPVISKIRNRKTPVGAGLILEIHDYFEIPIKEIKALIAESEK